MAGQVDDGELRRVGTRKQRGIVKQKIETGCVLVFARRVRSPISTVYSRIKVVLSMTNNTSWYRLADA